MSSKKLSTRYSSLIAYYDKKVPGLTPTELANEITLYEGLDVTDDTLSRMITNQRGKGYAVSYNNQYADEIVLVLGCMHFPFHNEKFWTSFLSYVQWLDGQGQPYRIILNGDILDMHSISRHNKGKIGIPGLTLGMEYALTNKELDKLDGVSSHVGLKHYNYGNHEAWYSQHMKEVDNAKLGEDVIASPDKALRLQQRGYLVNPAYSEAAVQVADLTVEHGTYVSVTAAHTALQKGKTSVMFNHTHRVSTSVEGLRDGSTIYGYNIGWGGDKDAKVMSYMAASQRATWQNGFGKITVEKGISYPEVILFRNERIAVDGKFFRG